MVSIAVGVCSS